MKLGAVAAMSTGIGYAALQVLGRTWGTTRSERAMPLPGDDVVSHPTVQTTHAITIDAPPEDLWPWLVQMGWHQGGWYTARWVDRIFFPANWPAVDDIIPELQNRQAGDFIPDGGPETECGFIIESLVPEQHLVLHSTSHLPLSWRQRLGATLDWTWSFHLSGIGGRTRLVFRVRGVVSPGWVRAVYQGVIVPADFVMAGQMMRGLKKRAESFAETGRMPVGVDSQGEDHEQFEVGFHQTGFHRVGYQ